MLRFKRYFSVQNEGKKRSFLKPILKFTSILGFSSLAILYVTNNNKELKQIFIANVPNGNQILKKMTEIEDKVSEFDFKKTAENIQQNTQNSMKNAKEFKNKITTEIQEFEEKVLKTSTELREKTQKNIDSAMEVIQSTAEALNISTKTKTPEISTKDQAPKVAEIPNKMETLRETPTTEVVVDDSKAVETKMNEHESNLVIQLDEKINEPPVLAATSESQIVTEELQSQQNEKNVEVEQKENTKSEAMIVNETIHTDTDAVEAVEPIHSPIMETLLQEISSDADAVEAVEPMHSPLMESLLQEISNVSKKIMELSASESIDKQGLIDAANKLESMKDTLAFLEADEISHFGHALEEQSTHFIALLDTMKNDAEQILIQKEQEYKSDLAKEISLVKESGLQLMEEKLHEQKQQLVKELEQDLIKQAETLNTFWETEVKKRVDEERQGRLARLDYLALKLKYLESISVQGAQVLERSTLIHKLQAATRALKLATNQTNLESEIMALKQLGKEDPLITTVLRSINPQQIQNFVSADTLNDWFDSILPQLKRDQLIPPNSGLLSILVGRALSYFMIDKQGLVPGNTTDSILSRTKYYLGRGDIDSAAREMNQLQGYVRQESIEWLDAARSYLVVDQAIKVIETRLRLQELGVIQ